MRQESAETFLAADLSAQPQRTELALPVRVTLLVRHEETARPEIGPNALGLDDSWVVLEEGASLTLPDVETGQGVSVTSKSWEIASLEPGSRSLGGFSLRVGDREVQVEPVAIEVTGLLAAEGEEPRALRGFRDVGELPDEPAEDLLRVVLVHAVPADVRGDPRHGADLARWLVDVHEAEKRPFVATPP